MNIKDLHIKLAHAVGDAITPDGVEFTNGNENGVRFSYEDRKTAIEGAFLGLYNIITQTGYEDIFLKEQNFTTPLYAQANNVHIYTFNITEPFIKIQRARLFNIDNHYLPKDLKILNKAPDYYIWHIGLGVAVPMKKNNGSVCEVILPHIFHFANPDEVVLNLLFHSVEGLGDYTKTIDLDSGFESVILNLAKVNLINLSEVK